MRAKLLLCTAAAMLAVAIFPIAVLASSTGVTVNGVAVEFSDQEPVVIDNRTLVPVRGVFEHLGFEVEWLDDTRTAVITNSTHELRIAVGSNVFTTNGVTHTLDVPAQLINGRTMLPIRAPLESVGINVGWEEATRTVTVSTPELPTQTVNRDVPVATVNGTEIGFFDVLFRLLEAEDILGISGQVPPHMQNYLREEAARIAATTVLFSKYAEQHGIFITDEDVTDFRTQAALSAQAFGFNEHHEMFAHYGIETAEQIERVIFPILLTDRVIDEIIISPEKFANFAHYMEEEEILAAKHILIRVGEFENEEAAMEFATEIWERAVAGEDFAELKEAYSEDPGRVSHPDGYTFTTGMMVPEFEQTTRELEIGEISYPIRAYHGIHIILRVEPNMEDVMRPRNAPTPEARRARAVIMAFLTKTENANIVFLPALYEIPVE